MSFDCEKERGVEREKGQWGNGTRRMIFRGLILLKRGGEHEGS